MEKTALLQTAQESFQTLSDIKSLTIFPIFLLSNKIPDIFNQSLPKDSFDTIIALSSAEEIYHLSFFKQDSQKFKLILTTFKTYLSQATSKRGITESCVLEK